MYFISRLLASITSVNYYQLVLIEPFKKTISFYLTFLLVITGISSIYFWNHDLPIIKQDFDTAKNELLARYPKDLVVTWNGQQLRTNYAVTVDFPEVTSDFIRSQANHLAYIQTDETVAEYHSLFVVTPTRLLYLDDHEVAEETKLSDFLGDKQFAITAQSLPDQVAQLYDSVKLGLDLSTYVFPPITFMVFLLINGYLIVIESAIIFVFFKLMKINMPYKKLLQLIISLFVPAGIVTEIARYAGWYLPISILSLSFWLFFVFVFFSLQRKLVR